MARGYWQPPNRDKLEACEGFYVSLDAFKIEDTEIRWNTFLEQVSNELQKNEVSLKTKKAWKTTEDGQSRFVLMCDNCVDIVAEETKGYYAIYALIPEDCIVPNLAKVQFWKYKLYLKNSLLKLYPGFIKQRKNYRQLIDIGQKNGCF